MFAAARLCFSKAARIWKICSTEIGKEKNSFLRFNLPLIFDSLSQNWWWEPGWFDCFCCLVPQAHRYLHRVQATQMSQHFPIFIDIATVPPLVIGAGPAIKPKIRLLRKFAPVVELVTDGVFPQDELPDPGVRQLSGVMPSKSQPLFQGRPLIVIDTGDDRLDGRLATTAKAIGVPVNVPDRPALCSFYFGSLVDRDPVTIAISTSGLAPVLGQWLRARLEDMLAPEYGCLAWYLWRLRDRLRHLSPAQRRETQHRIIDGAVARLVVAGEDEIADKLAVRMMPMPGMMRTEKSTFWTAVPAHRIVLAQVDSRPCEMPILLFMAQMRALPFWTLSGARLS